MTISKRTLVDIALMALLGMFTAALAHWLGLPHVPLLIGVAGGGGYLIGSRKPTGPASRSYHWPSWCRSHRRPHIRVRQCCLTNWDRRQYRHAVSEMLLRATPQQWKRPRP